MNIISPAKSVRLVYRRCEAHLLGGRLVGWSVGRLVGWSVGRLVGWSGEV